MSFEEITARKSRKIHNFSVYNLIDLEMTLKNIETTIFLKFTS